jgi:hypothetical protein
MELNGLNFYKWNTKGGSFGNNEIQNWLMPGTNILKIEIQNTNPHIKLSNYTKHHLQFSLHGLESPGAPDDSNALWDIGLDPEKATHLEFTFEMPAKQVPPSKLWIEADKISELTETDKLEIIRQRDEVISAFKKSNFLDIWKLREFAIVDLASQSGKSVEEAKKRHLEDCAMMAEVIDLTTTRAGKGEPVFTILAQGKVVELSGSKSQYGIEFNEKQAGATGGTKLFFARMRGSWKLVR